MLLKSRQGQHIHERAYHQRPEMRLGPHQQRPEMRFQSDQQRQEMSLRADQKRPELSLRADQQRPEMNPRLRADYFRSSITDKAIGFTTPCLLGLPHHVCLSKRIVFITGTQFSP